MKKISKKTILKPNKEYTVQIEEKQITDNSNNNDYNRKISQTSRITINNPNIESKSNNIDYNNNNVIENVIQKKYSRKLPKETKNQNKKTEEGYLDSDLEDPDNLRIYNNVVQRIQEKSGASKISDKITGKSDNESKYQKKISFNSNKPSVEIVKKTQKANIITKTNDKNTNTTNYSNIPSRNNQRSTADIKNNNNNDKNKTSGYTYKINTDDKNNTNNTSGYRYIINTDKYNKKDTSGTGGGRRNIHKEEKKEENKSATTIKLRRKTVERGGDYNNVQVRHIIYSKKNIDFHIVDPLVVDYDGLRPKINVNVNKDSINNKRKDSTGNVKSSWKSSCDNINVTPKTKKPSGGKTTVYYHCSDFRQKRDSDKNKIDDSIKKGIYQVRNPTDLSSIPRAKNLNQNTFNQTEIKEKYSRKYITDNSNNTNKSNDNNSNNTINRTVSNTINTQSRYTINNNDNSNTNNVIHNTATNYYRRRNENNTSNNNTQSKPSENNQVEYNLLKKPNSCHVNYNINNNNNNNKSSFANKNINNNNNNTYTQTKNAPKNTSIKTATIPSNINRQKRPSIQSQDNNNNSFYNSNNNSNNNSVISIKNDNTPNKATQNQNQTQDYSKYSQYKRNLNTQTKPLPAQNKDNKINNNTIEVTKSNSRRIIYNPPVKKEDEKIEYKKNKTNEINIDLEEIKPKYKTVVKVNDVKDLSNQKKESKSEKEIEKEKLEKERKEKLEKERKEKEKKEKERKEKLEKERQKILPKNKDIKKEINDEKKDDKTNKEKNSESMFLLKNYFKIFKHKITSFKDTSGYVKWFRRNCDNNNDVSHKSIKNRNAYFSPRIIYNNRRKTKRMPYDEWFNRNCEKSENVIKKQKLKNAQLNLMKKLLENIINDKKKGTEKLNNELKKLDNTEQKDFLNNLRSSIKNKNEKEKVDNIINEINKKKKETEKAKLIKSAINDDTKKNIENLINLWEDDDYMDNLLLNEREKEDKFDYINTLFKENKKDELIKELNSLGKSNRVNVIKFLKENNEKEKERIDEIDDLSNKQKKIDMLVSVLGGKREKKDDKKEKLKKIVDIFLTLDKNTKKDCVNYMRSTAGDDEQKNDDLYSIINELPSEEKESYINFDIDKNDYSYSNSSNSLEKSDVKDYKDKVIDTELLNEETEDFKLLDDDLFDIVNEIQNTEEDEKKKLDDDEFKDLADNMINCLYKSNNEENDYSENEDELKNIINSLNDMNKEDRKKTVGILKEKADDDSKKKKFSKFANKMKAIVKAKKMFKNIIDKKKEEEEKLGQFADNVLDELESQDTIYLDKSNDISNIEEEKKIKNKNENKDKDKDKNKNKATNLIKSLEEDEQKIIYEKLKNNAKNSKQRDKVNKLFKSMKFINKMKKFKNEVQKKLGENGNDILSDAEEMNSSDLSKSIDKEEIKTIVYNFEKDLYEEHEKPLTRKEERENEKKNKEKIKEISKVIDCMNTRDQNLVINNLKKKANNDFKKSQFDRLSEIIKNINNVKVFLEKIKQKKASKSTIVEENKDLSEAELNNFINKIKLVFHNNDDKEKEDEKNINNNLLDIKEEKKFEQTAELLNKLTPHQQKQILNCLQSK